MDFYEEKDREEPSKIISFLWHQIAQQPTMKTSLKITELKLSLAMRIISWKSKDKSQCTPKKVQQASLKGHEKKRCL
jgi:hypothetical protein